MSASRTSEATWAKRASLGRMEPGNPSIIAKEANDARAVLLRRGPPRRAEPGRAGRPAAALEGPPRAPLRRLDGLHARHAGEPRRVPPDLHQVPGTNFALARIGAVIALSCGAIL